MTVILLRGSGGSDHGGLITPPVGMNLFVIQAVSPNLSLAALSRGILPFLAADSLRVGAIILLPGLVLWLPAWLGLGRF